MVSSNHLEPPCMHAHLPILNKKLKLAIFLFIKNNSNISQLSMNYKFPGRVMLNNAANVRASVTRYVFADHFAH